MGILLGTAHADPRSGRIHVRIGDAFDVPQVKATARSVVMLKGAWSAFWKQAVPQNSLSIVGWYHSHPNYGVFLSATDRETQRVWFAQAWQIALVLDPVRGQSAAFVGENAAPAELVISHQARAGRMK